MLGERLVILIFDHVMYKKILWQYFSQITIKFVPITGESRKKKKQRHKESYKKAPESLV